MLKCLNLLYMLEFGMYMAPHTWQVAYSPTLFTCLTPHVLLITRDVSYFYSKEDVV